MSLKPISFICNVQQSIICFGGGAGSGGSTSNSSPWTGQQPYLTDTFQQAQNLQNTYTPQYYGYSGSAGSDPTQTGQSTVAPFNSQETGAINQIGNLGLNGTQGMGTANNAVNQYASGSMLSGNNPYFGSVVNQIQSSLTPGLMGSFSQGSTDNPNIAFAASQGLGNAVGNAASQNYETQTQNQLNAASLAPQMYNTQMSGANAALTAGQAAQTQAQNQLTNQVNAYNYYQQLPYTQLNNYADLVQGQYGQATTNTAPAAGLFGTLFGGSFA